MVYFKITTRTFSYLTYSSLPPLSTCKSRTWRQYLLGQRDRIVSCARYHYGFFYKFFSYVVIGACALRQAWKGNIKCEDWCNISSSLTWKAVKMSRNFLLFVPSSNQSRAFPRHPHFVWSSSQASSRGTRQGRSTLSALHTFANFWFTHRISVMAMSPLTL